MTKKVSIDFSKIDSMSDFYNQLGNKMKLPVFFGRNLDALYDVISGYAKLPLDIEFRNVRLDQIGLFEDLLETMEDAEQFVSGFSFSCFLQHYLDEEE